MSKPLAKKNITNAKGNKAAGLNNKLSEDMVTFISYSKIKSKMPSHFTIPEIQDILIVKILEVYLVILHSQK
jgi:hypothetical protein